jgi:hypothetical protein
MKGAIVACIADFLQVGQAKQFDVVLTETAIGYRPPDRSKAYRVNRLV